MRAKKAVINLHLHLRVGRRKRTAQPQMFLVALTGNKTWRMRVVRGCFDNAGVITSALGHSSKQQFVCKQDTSVIDFPGLYRLTPA